MNQIRGTQIGLRDQGRQGQRRIYALGYPRWSHLGLKIVHGSWNANVLKVTVRVS